MRNQMTVALLFVEQFRATNSRPEPYRQDGSLCLLQSRILFLGHVAIKCFQHVRGQCFL